MKRRILVVEDDHDLSRILRDNLQYEGFDVECVTMGGAAISAARDFVPDLVLLDVMLPDRNGFDLCGVLSGGGRTPVIMLTALGQKTDKLRGLRLGADDYVTKPFDLEELFARIKIVLRRANAPLERLTLGDVILNFRTLTATKAARPLQLTHREFDLLRYLAERDRVVYRNELLKQVWGYAEPPHTRSVDQAIGRLRKKIEADPHHPRFIHTVHGNGYQLTPDAA